MLDTRIYDERIGYLQRRMVLRMGDVAFISHYRERCAAIQRYADNLGLVLRWEPSGSWHFTDAWGEWSDSPTEHITTYDTPAYNERKLTSWRLARKVDQHVDAVFNRASKEQAMTRSANNKPYELVRLYKEEEQTMSTTKWQQDQAGNEDCRPTNKAGSLAELDQARNYFADNEPADAQQFVVGDRVVTPWSKAQGTIIGYKPAEYIVKLDNRGGAEIGYYADQLTPAPDKLSAEEAWLEVALLVGSRCLAHRTDPNYYWEGADDFNTETRHLAYIILGGNSVPVGRTGTDEHEQARARVNDLIDRAEKGTGA